MTPGELGMTPGESGAAMGESGRDAGDLLEDAVEEGNAREAAGRGDLLLAGAGVRRAVLLRVPDPERVDQVRKGHAVELIDQFGDVGLVRLQATGHLRHREVRLQEGAALEDEPFEIVAELAWHGVSGLVTKVGFFCNKSF